MHNALSREIRFFQSVEYDLNNFNSVLCRNVDSKARLGKQKRLEPVGLVRYTEGGRIERDHLPAYDSRSRPILAFCSCFELISVRIG